MVLKRTCGLNRIDERKIKSPASCSTSAKFMCHVDTYFTRCEVMEIREAWRMPLWRQWQWASHSSPPHEDEEWIDTGWHFSYIPSTTKSERNRGETWTKSNEVWNPAFSLDEPSLFAWKFAGSTNESAGFRFSFDFAPISPRFRRGFAREDIKEKAALWPLTTLLIVHHATQSFIQRSQESRQG